MKKQLIVLTLLLSLSLNAVAEEKGFKPLFNGKDFTGWAGPIDNYQVTDGTIQCKPGKGGTIYTNERGDRAIQQSSRLGGRGYSDRGKRSIT